MSKNTKTILKFITIIILVLFIFLAFKIFFIYKSISSFQDIKYISYSNDSIINTIDSQLKGLNIDEILSKEKLILEKNIEELQEMVKNGDLTYEEITALYLIRIKTYDQSTNGLNSTISINENAILEARKCDKEKLNTSPLYGIPVMLKDNINTNTMPTTAGSVALKDFIPKNNAPIVNSLINDGAIILGKNNLSEFANFMSFKNPSGYTNLKGQTINPYGPLTISTLGSSSGSAVSVTSNFSVLSIGTETTGSIVAPAAIQNVVGFRPSKSAINTDGIIPLSSSLDTAGPIAKNVKDTAIAYNSITLNQKLNLNQLDKNYLKGKTIALFNSDKNNTEAQLKLETALKNAGASIVYLDIDDSSLNNMTVIIAEFNNDLNKYLSENNAPYKTLSSIVEFNNTNLDKNAKFGQDLLEKAIKGNDTTKKDTLAQINKAQNILNTFISDDISAIAFISNTHAALPCFAGAPEITVPLYIDDENVPHGATFVTLPKTDIEALKIAYAFESNTNARKSPILK